MSIQLIIGSRASKRSPQSVLRNLDVVFCVTTCGLVGCYQLFRRT